MKKVSSNSPEVKLVQKENFTPSNQLEQDLQSLDIEPRLRRIKGFRFLPMLRFALQKELKLESDVQYHLAAD